MNIHPGSNLFDIIKEYPFLEQYLLEYDSKFSLLKSKAMRMTVGRMATLERVAGIAGISVEKLMNDIAAKIKEKTGEETGISSEIKGGEEQSKIGMMKKLIHELHAGADFESVKQRFNEAFANVDPSEIAQMEEQLIRQGLPVGEIQKLCDVHVGIFKESLEKQELPDLPKGHPAFAIIEKNRVIMEAVNKLGIVIKKLSEDLSSKNLSSMKREFDDIITCLLEETDKHYLWKENQLFPFLEKHDFTGPTQVMWGIHDQIRTMLKGLYTALGKDDFRYIHENGQKLSVAVIEMIYKENKIMLPTALDLLSDDEWKEISKVFEESAYAGASQKYAASAAGLVELDMGALSPEQINLMLTNLPVDITFVDESDRVRYYSASKERIFPRSPGIIGREVMKCHPPKSVHIVKDIVEQFRNGAKDAAEFWIQMTGRLIHIRYFALRDSSKNYRGTIEVTQDVTEIQKLEGERRLMD